MMGLAWLFLSSVQGEEEQMWRTMDHLPPQHEGAGRMWEENPTESSQEMEK